MVENFFDFARTAIVDAHAKYRLTEVKAPLKTLHTCDVFYKDRAVLHCDCSTELLEWLRRLGAEVMVSGWIPTTRATQEDIEFLEIYNPLVDIMTDLLNDNLNKLIQQMECMVPGKIHVMSSPPLGPDSFFGKFKWELR